MPGNLKYRKEILNLSSEEATRKDDIPTKLLKTALMLSYQN